MENVLDLVQPDSNHQVMEENSNIRSRAQSVDSRISNHDIVNQGVEQSTRSVVILDNPQPLPRVPSTPPPDQDNGKEDTNSASSTLQDFDWKYLHTRFEEDMVRMQQQEIQLSQELERLMKFYALWMQFPSMYDHERAVKRLRTRITYVQHEETQLQEKRAKRDEVIQAFQSALALLSRF